MNYNRLKDLLSEKKITIPQLAGRIGMSKGGLYTAISNQTLTVITLEKIAEALDVPVPYFFYDEDQNEEDLLYQIDQSEKEIGEKDLQIDLLWERIGEKRYLLRMIYQELKELFVEHSTLGDMTVGEYEAILKKLVNEIDKSENFSGESDLLKKRQEERLKRRQDRLKSK